VLCGCDGEWQWLLDEEDDELTMVLAVLVWLSPLLYSFLCRSPLVFPLLSFSSPLLFLSSSFSCFYKPKNGLRCNVQLGNDM
jgi:hypothetical protein